MCVKESQFSFHFEYSSAYCMFDNKTTRTRKSDFPSFNGELTKRKNIGL